MKAFAFQIRPVGCPVCRGKDGHMVREKVTPHMKRTLRKKAGGRRPLGVMAWRGAFCCHRIALVGAAYRLLDSNPGGVGKP